MSGKLDKAIAWLESHLKQHNGRVAIRTSWLARETGVSSRIARKAIEQVCERPGHSVRESGGGRNTTYYIKQD
jgi:hypothetical protein